MNNATKRLMIAGTGSGSGKTTITVAILAALAELGHKAISFKCGPDYIDPMFHTRATGVESRNLDIYLMGEQGVKYALENNIDDFDIAVLEGVMGIYDGQSNTSFASSNHLSLLTDTPAVLVVNARGLARSINALISGYLNFEANNIKAILLNNVRETSYNYYKQMIEAEQNVPVIGHMPMVPGAEIESRHLGLVTAEEITDLRAKIELLKAQALKTIDFDALLRVGEMTLTPPTNHPPATPNSLDVITPIDSPTKPRIYVSDDEAFCFYYHDNLQLLKALGAELVTFSPLKDDALPADADGLIFWGGYPELYAAELAANRSMRDSLVAAIGGGLPTYAECGGFMYLLQSLTDAEGAVHQMLGVLPGGSSMTDRLQDFGYFEITANRDTLLCAAGQSINAHFFHYAKGDFEGDAFTATKRDGKTLQTIFATDNVFAGFQHLHFYGNPEFARNFVAACAAYRKARHD